MLDEFTAAQDNKLSQLEAENEAWINGYNARVEALQAENELLTENHEAELERIEENYNRRKASLERQIKDINDYTSKEINLRNEATALIEGRSKEFHDNLMQWMSEYTTLTDYEMDRVWKNAYTVLDAYNGKQINVRDTLNILVAQMSSFEDSISGAASAMERLADASKQVKSVSTSSSGYGTYTGAGSGMWQAEVRHNGGVVGETTPKTVNLNTPKKPNEIDVRAEKGEVILSNKKSASDVHNALDYLEDALPANDTRAMLAAFVNDASSIQDLIASPTSLSGSLNSSIANKMLSNNLRSLGNASQFEKLPIGGDTIEIDHSVTIQGNVDAETWPGMKKTLDAARKYIGEQAWKRDRALNKPNFGKMY